MRVTFSSVKRFSVAIALIILGISVFWSFRVRAADEAAQFKPLAAHHSVILPTRTEITAVIQNGILSSSAAGSSITALVSAPVLFDRIVAIPRAARLEGRMNTISTNGETAKADITFNALTIDGQSWKIQALPIAVVIPVRSDAAIVMDALRTLVTAGISAGMGASSQDQRLLKDILGKAIKTSLPVKSSVSITVILVHDLQI